MKVPVCEFAELVARGYTVQRIEELLTERGYTVPARLRALVRQISPDAAAEQDRMDANLRRDFGLARKLERVQRLCGAAEAIEARAVASVKWSAEYRHLLTQIRQELEPLGIEVTAGDPWAALLLKIADMR